jgi:hypothetical protein
MKNYYYNPKTRDLTIFDTESKEMLVLERIEGIRVLTSSELMDPTRVSRDEDFNQEAPVKVYKKHFDSAQKRKCGKCGKPGHRSYSCGKFVSPPRETTAPAKKGGKWKCKNCGELGHGAKTCKNPKASPPPTSKELPDEEVTKIAREERGDAIASD